MDRRFYNKHLYLMASVEDRAFADKLNGGRDLPLLRDKLLR